MNIFYWRLVLISQVFARTLTTFGFRCKIITAKLLLFEVNILLDSKRVNTLKVWWLRNLETNILKLRFHI